MLNKSAQDFIAGSTSSWKFRLWCISHLPSLAYWGVKVPQLSAERCEATIPFSRRTKNPFQSIYFAAQAGAAEISTGALVKLHIAGKGKYSMLVTQSTLHFYKKAISTITFTCDQGELIKTQIDHLGVGDSCQFVLISVGTSEEGEVVSQLEINWSVLKKK